MIWETKNIKSTYYEWMHGPCETPELFMLQYLKRKFLKKYCATSDLSYLSVTLSNIWKGLVTVTFISSLGILNLVPFPLHLVIYKLSKFRFCTVIKLVLVQDQDIARDFL